MPCDDLLRMSQVLHCEEDVAETQSGCTSNRMGTARHTDRLAQLVLLSYNGRAPHKESPVLDLPVSTDAVSLVIVWNMMRQRADEPAIAESVWYGLNGNIVRVALPALQTLKTRVSYAEVSLSGSQNAILVRTEGVPDLTALVQKTAEEGFTRQAAKAVARAAMNFAFAEGAALGVQAAAGKDAGPVVSWLGGVLAKTVDIVSEEADTRCSRTLPDEIRMHRLSVQPGEYDLQYLPRTWAGQPNRRGRRRYLILKQGETRILLEWVLE